MAAFVCYDGFGLRFMKGRIMKYANTIAYEFFLAQFFCFKFTKSIVSRWGMAENTAVKMIVAFVICTGLAILMHEIVTKPGRTMLEKLERRTENRDSVCEL